MTEHVLILDFGSQVTQLIARRVREAGVYCEIRPYSTPAAEIERLAPKGVILSGGPASLTEAEAPRPDEAVYALGIPLLGICYGQQAMCAALGGAVESASQTRVRPGPPQHRRALRALRRRLAGRRARAGVDEPRRRGLRGA